MKKRFILFVLSFFFISNAGNAGKADVALNTGEKDIAQAGQKKRRGTKKKSALRSNFGIASFYANKFVGRKTASGSIYSHMKLTAAHNHVPLGTWLRVTNLKNMRSVIVKVTDRLHRKNRRMVDLSRSAATALGTTGEGLLKVKVDIIGKAST